MPSRKVALGRPGTSRGPTTSARYSRGVPRPSTAKPVNRSAGRAPMANEPCAGPWTAAGLARVSQAREEHTTDSTAPTTLRSWPVGRAGWRARRPAARARHARDRKASRSLGGSVQARGASARSRHGTEGPSVTAGAERGSERTAGHVMPDQGSQTRSQSTRSDAAVA